MQSLLKLVVGGTAPAILAGLAQTAAGDAKESIAASQPATNPATNSATHPATIPSIQPVYPTMGGFRG